MDPEIQRALAAGYTPQQVAAELQRRGLPVPPELLAPTGAPAAVAADASGVTAPAALQQMQPAAADGSAAILPGAAAVAGGAAAAGVYGGQKLVNRALPGTVADARVGRAVEQSGGRDALLQRLADFEQTGRGSLVTMGDLSTPLGEQGADFVATRNEPARASLLQLHRERQAGVPDRLLGDVRDLAPGGYSSADFLLNLSKQSQRDFAAGPLGYQGLRDMNPVISPAQAPRMAAFLESPRLQKLWVDAAADARLGPLPPANALSFETLQDLKERLDDATENAFLNGRGNIGRRLAASRDELVDLLRTGVPDYERVAAQYDQFVQHQKAVQAGLDAWSNQAVQLPDLARQVQDMTPEQRSAFQRGMVSGYIRDIENARTNRNLANEMMSRSAVTEQKLLTVFGSQQAFEDAVKRFGVEADMARMGNYVGGSATARRRAAGSDLGEAITETAADVPTHGVKYSLLGRLVEGYKGKVAAEMAPRFTAQGADAVRGLLMRLPK